MSLVYRPPSESMFEMIDYHFLSQEMTISMTVSGDSFFNFRPVVETSEKFNFRHYELLRNARTILEFIDGELIRELDVEDMIGVILPCDAWTVIERQHQLQKDLWKFHLYD